MLKKEKSTQRIQLRRYFDLCIEKMKVNINDRIMVKSGRLKNHARMKTGAERCRCFLKKWYNILKFILRINLKRAFFDRLAHHLINDGHTVVAVDKSFRSKALDTDDSYEFTFMTVGDFDYFCGLHPHMKAKIVVAP